MNDYERIATEAGEVLVRREALGLFAQLDSIVFDVDGVLMDVSESIQQVHKEVARRYLQSLGWTNCDDMVEPADVDAFRRAGGFNNDWDIAEAWLMLFLLKGRIAGSTEGAVAKAFSPSLQVFAADLARRGGYLKSARAAIREMCRPGDWEAIESLVDRAALDRTFQEAYSGDLCPEVYGFEPSVGGQGMIHKDRPLLDRKNLPALKLGIATGRTGGETRVAVKFLGCSDVFTDDVLTTEDDRLWKPDPRILDLAVSRLGGKLAMYIGDTPDDMRTVRRYNEDFGPMLSCMVRTGLKGSKDDGADLIADDVNAALAAVRKILGDDRP